MYKGNMRHLLLSGCSTHVIRIFTLAAVFLWVSKLLSALSQYLGPVPTLHNLLWRQSIASLNTSIYGRNLDADGIDRVQILENGTKNQWNRSLTRLMAFSGLLMRDGTAAPYPLLQKALGFFALLVFTVIWFFWLQSTLGFLQETNYLPVALLAAATGSLIIGACSSTLIVLHVWPLCFYEELRQDLKKL